MDKLGLREVEPPLTFTSLVSGRADVVMRETDPKGCALSHYITLHPNCPPPTTTTTPRKSRLRQKEGSGLFSDSVLS